MRPNIILVSGLLLFAASPAFADVSVAPAEIQFVSGTGADRLAPEPSDTYFASDDGDDGDDGDSIAGMSAQLSDPAMQDDVAHMVETATRAMMQLPVGQFARAIETARPGTVDRDIPADATLGRIAGRDAQDLPVRLGYQSRNAMAMMGRFAQGFAAMMPEFQKMAKTIEADISGARGSRR